MPLEQIIISAIAQGITLFLPVSATAHMTGLAHLFGWPLPDAYLPVMLHSGSLAALIAYFYADLWRMLTDLPDIISKRSNDKASNNRRWMALFILLASIPTALFALLLRNIGYFETLYADPAAQLRIVGWGAIMFGGLLYLADRMGPEKKSLDDVTLTSTLMIGVMQMFALVPGTSRSGVTMTAARFLGFSRLDAARYAFLLGVPILAGAIAVDLDEAWRMGNDIPPEVWMAAGISFLASFAAIDVMMMLLQRISLAPFAFYRLALGCVLLYVSYKI